MGGLRVDALCRTKCHVPNSCSSSQLVLRTWMLPSLASPVWRRCRLNAGDRSISLVGFRARRCSFPAQSRNHVHGIHVAVWTVCDEQWALNFTSSNWGNSSQNPSAARNLISIADPDSLFLAGNGMPACGGKHGPGSCYSCTCHNLFRGLSITDGVSSSPFGSPAPAL